MYSAVLSVFLMGLIPAWETPDLPPPPASLLSVALPARDDSAKRLAGLARKMTASGVLVVDLQSAQPLFARSANVRRPFASIAKLMTAVLIVEHHTLDETVVVPRAAGQLEGDRYLKVGNTYTVGDLLSALLMASSNDAAYTLAIHHSGSTEAFAEAMNSRAKVLGLRDTSFQNPIGFDNPKQWSTARDVAWLSAFALRFPTIRARMSTSDASVTSLEGTTLSLFHTHSLLHRESTVVAGKTGTTLRAGECLVSLVQEDGREYLVVLLNSAARYADMQAVLRALHDLRVSRS